MEYSTKELSRLSGVTTRTLRWYDKIGLLKPLRVAESGYRFYGEAQVDRLQDILYYRALGVELARIKECLDDPSFNRVSALYSHLEKLKTEKARIDELIRSVENTIRAEERNETMTDEKKFEAFKKKAALENEKAYGAEAREKYGDEQVNEASAALLELTYDKFSRYEALGADIIARLEAAVKSGVSPESEEGKVIAELHRQWLSYTIRKYSAAQHRGIAQLYTADERFTAYYDRAVPDCAQFLTQAVMFWIK